MTPNIAAFLTMIAHGEGTDQVPDPYRCCYGFSHTIKDLSNHPAITGEWMGESISQLGPQYVGLISTAAGRYQINRKTWESIQQTLSLPDFTGPCQDDAAIFLIKGQGALNLVNGGQVTAAIEKCHPIWASLPGSTSGQPQVPLQAAIQTYTEAGGAFA